MIIVMHRTASQVEIQAVVERLTEHGFDIHRSTGSNQTVLGVVGVVSDIDPRDYELMPGVAEVVRVSEPYKLVGRIFKREDTVITIKGVAVGGRQIVLMAGPCSVESRDAIRTAARFVKASGAQFLRGGAFKPRSSPYSFQGLGVEGLKYLHEAADENGLLVISEVMDRADLPEAVKYIDVIQVGARNMQNYTLLRELGTIPKPVLLKRGMSATIKELLMSAEYIMSGGNHDVMLCERGIRTFESYTRNTMDISAIPILKQLSHLPVIADPSHGIGIRNKVAPMARAAVAAGADGLLIEAHQDPDHALSDGAQSLYPEQLNELVQQLKIIAQAVDRTF
ncbi:MAG TPA: 3-deoxy-7-phosphoheptulonate synthase [candidate division Zixibacteria bacterium]|nr:3-deoxy-7-phosphoheptulonate synthase [candidate division Zixibacteria bacterium]